MKLASFQALAAVLEAADVRYFNAEYDSALLSPLSDNLTIRFVSRATLIRMKSEANRPQDQADIAQLSALKDRNDGK